ncbi:MAG TPA: secretin N-terminal domain-containing protein [Bryobacteraceae bacterium]|jgi:hypothetical protein
MKRILLTLFAAAMAWAQTQQQAIIDVKYADVNQLSNMLRGVFGQGVQGNPAFHVITVTGSSDTVAAVTAAVKRFDVPPPPQPDVELTVYLISGLAQGQGDQVPQELAATVKQLHALFAYKSYKLADSVMLRGRPVVGVDNRGGAQVDGAALNGRYALSYQYLNVSSEAPRTIHIEGLNFRLNQPHSGTVTADGKTTTVTDYNDMVARISTNLDIREGQKTVVGKSSVGSGDAVILVIVPKVAD